MAAIGAVDSLARRRTAAPSPSSATAVGSRATGARIPSPRSQSYADWLDERDARVPAPPDPRVQLVTESGKIVGSTSESNLERMRVALEPHHGPLTAVPA